MYTAYDDPVVDATITGHMTVLRDLCLAALGSNLASLVLSGSFGRGEGSVLFDEDGAVTPLRDYDTRVVVHHAVDHAVVEQIRDDFMRQTGLGCAQTRFSGEGGFTLTLEPVTVAELHASFLRDRDLRVYDHVHASRLIYGTDYAPRLSFPAVAIPKINGLRFLFQKMIGLVGHFAGPDSGNDLRPTLLYECNKTFVEIGTALVLLADAYVPSYRARAALLDAQLDTWFPDLTAEFPCLASNIRLATWEKLRPGTTPPLPPWDAFQRAREMLLGVHRFYVRQLYGLNVAPDSVGLACLRRTLVGDYYRVPVTRWLQSRNLDLPPARWAVNLAYQRAGRLKFAKGMGRQSARLLWDGVRRSEAPALDIYLAAWCTLAAATDPPNIGLLHCADRALARLPGMAAPAQDLPVGWSGYRTIRDRLTRAYSTWEHNR